MFGLIILLLNVVYLNYVNFFVMIFEFFSVGFIVCCMCIVNFWVIGIERKYKWYKCLEVKDVIFCCYILFFLIFKVDVDLGVVYFNIFRDVG